LSIKNSESQTSFWKQTKATLSSQKDKISKLEKKLADTAQKNDRLNAKLRTANNEKHELKMEKEEKSRMVDEEIKKRKAVEGELEALKKRKISFSFSHEEGIVACQDFKKLDD